MIEVQKNLLFTQNGPSQGAAGDLVISSSVFGSPSFSLFIDTSAAQNAPWHLITSALRYSPLQRVTIGVMGGVIFVYDIFQDILAYLEQYAPDWVSLNYLPLSLTILIYI